MRRFAVLFALILMVAACGQTPESGSSTSTTGQAPTTTTVPAPLSTDSADSEETTTTMSSSQPSEGQEVLVAAVKDLARRLGVTEDAIEVTSAMDGYWNDASVGCPEEGESYAQLILNGYRIELQADGTVYVYHQGGTEAVFLCEEPDTDAFVPGKTVPEPSIPPPRE